MSIDFDPGPELRALADRTTAFIRDEVIPAEPRDNGEHGLDGGLRAELQQAAKIAGLFAPQVAPSSVGSASTCAGKP